MARNKEQLTKVILKEQQDIKYPTTQFTNSSTEEPTKDISTHPY